MNDMMADIYVVGIGGADSEGMPFAVIKTAICDVCGDWATGYRHSVVTTADGSILQNRRVRRELHVFVYACERHEGEISDALLDEYGTTDNSANLDLVNEADRVMQAIWEEKHRG